MSQQVRTRFAPSPTGHLHIGSARSALFSYLFTKHSNGSFIIRIEDTDQNRNLENAEQKLLDSLKWLGIDWDESVDIGGSFAPYRSMDRLVIYQKYINILIENKHAYYCYCTPEEINAERQISLEKGETPKYSGKCRYITAEEKSKFENDARKPSVRFKVPSDQVITVEDKIRGLVEFESNGIGDFVIARPDGIPTYNFAVTVDDHLMEITHVIRGEEHLSNTPRQIMIYNAFSWVTPQFAHVSLILNQDRKKMSKRDESIIQFVEQYKEFGFLPEAIINFIALLGWSPEGEEEIFSMDDLIKQFSLERVAKSPAVFDVQKLYWMNNNYIKKAPLDKIVRLSLPHLQAAGYLPDSLNQQQNEWTKLLIGLYIEKMNYMQEIVQLTRIFFEEELVFDEEEKAILSEEHIPIVMKEFIKQVNLLDDFKPEAIKSVLKAVQKETGYKGKQLFMPIRIAVTGEQHGPDLIMSIYLLGKNKVLTRISNILTKGE